MLHDVPEAGELPPGELRTRYESRLRKAIEENGADRVAAVDGVERGTVDALAAGDSPAITVETAAAILATRTEPGAEAILAELRDHLLLGMTTAVLDVDAIESGLNTDLDAREIQQKIEGRLPMELSELALIHSYIEREKP